MMRRLLAWALFLLGLPAGALAAEAPRVLLAGYSGVISPVAAEYLDAAIAKAGEQKDSALVIELDTPGGLDLSMREIVKSILASPVPVIVYVGPAGARSASAGVFVTMAAHVAAMTPGTNIGAAHPIELGGGLPGVAGKEKGEPDSVMESKITNDASAYLEAIAARRGRNASWAALVVAKSTSVTSAEAVRQRVVDLEAESLPALLEAVDGRRLADFPGRPLRTKGAVVERFEMSRRQRLLAAVSDPNIAMILMTLGVSGLLIELYSPGLILPGIVGASSLILAFYSFQTLSANYAGLLLIVLGLLLFVLEFKVHSFGLLTLSGAASVLFGALMLFRDSAGGLRVSPGVIASTVTTMLGVVAVLLAIVRQAFKRKARTGAEGLKGAKGVAASALDPGGTVRLSGELWKAESVEGSIEAGSEVAVADCEGLTLKVRRLKPSPSPR